MLARSVVADGLTVRAIEELVREHNDEAEGIRRRRTRGRPDGGQRRGSGRGGAAHGGRAAANGSSGSASGPRQLPPPGILELEELLASHLNTRVKVDMQRKRGRVVVEFATLEDLERIYKLMVGGVETTRREVDHVE